MRDLMSIYKSWRETNGSKYDGIDINFARARRDFSKFAGFRDEIPDAELEKLEQEYDTQMN